MSEQKEKISKMQKSRFKNGLTEMENGCLSAMGLNIFYYICGRVDNKESSEVTISYDAIRLNSGFTAHGDAALEDAIMEVGRKLVTDFVNAGEIRTPGRTRDRRSLMLIFSKYETDPDARALRVQVMPEFVELFNEYKREIREQMQLKEERG